MEAHITIDLEAATPPFEQVLSQISALVAVGELPPGTRLPTVRGLAGDLGVAAGTVARAYRELEMAGVVTTHRRQGTVVAATRQGQPPAGATRPPEVLAAVEHLVAEGRRAGLDDGTLLALLQGRLRQLGK